MSPDICVDGMVIRLTAGAGWNFNVAAYKDVTINSSGKKLTVDNKSVVLQPEITAAMSSFTSQYTAPPYTTPGTLLGVTLTSGLIPSTKFKHQSVGLILDSLSGNFSISVTVPAIQPPSTPDPVLTKTGTWQIIDSSQPSKLTQD